MIQGGRITREFQLTHSRGVRPDTLAALRCTPQFQLTHSRGVRPQIHFLLLQCHHFNSRTHVECDGVCRSKIDKLNISTHALTWSATGAMEDGELKTVDFNSRTHVECDMIFAFSCRTVDNFNSRTHVECDPKFIFYFYNVTISTHALTWSATDIFQLLFS